MIDVLNTLLFEHELRLVALAVIVCILASFSCVSVLVHARRTEGVWRYVWLGVAAASVGFGIWTTHFIAMVAFDAGFPAGYDIGLSVLSLLVAVAISGLGLWFAATGNKRSDLILGGAVVGIGITTMHYTGMAAMLVGGQIGWDWGLVAASILFGIVFGGLALWFGADSVSRRSRWIGTGFLTLAVASMHFTAMGAAGFENCFAIVTPNQVTTNVIAVVAGGLSILILLLVLGAIYVDLRDRMHAAREASRMRGLADAAVEGLIVCDGLDVVTVNASFQRLIGDRAVDLVGHKVTDFLPASAVQSVGGRADGLVETELRTLEGKIIPVEIVLREVDFGGKAHKAIAVRDLRARKDAERHIRFLAHHDAMTGLANRASFNTRLDEEIATAGRLQQRFAILYLDLDRFKEVNDLFGHAAGDAMLQKVAGALEETLGGQNLAARLGGDEFAVILSNLSSPAQAGNVAQTILDAFAHENASADNGIVISASIGITVFPDDAQDAESLMTYADTALYCAKEEGRGVYRFFESEMGTQVRDRRQLEYELRQAVANEELTLVYQPQVDLATGDTTGFEALVRWDHPERGAVPPGDFIPIAEESALILSIGEWVLREACMEAARWRAPLTIAVNVSPLQLHAPHFARFVEETLIQSGLAPYRLEIEITETALIRNMNRALTSLRKIKAMGVKIAMDDFGTGYSSLSNLRAFPFDKIKVDQQFIRAVHDNDQSATIVRAVLGLGKGLNLPVLAEGVERAEEVEFLKGEVCDSAQGYWLGRPQTIDNYAAIVSGRATKISPAPTPTRAIA
ncbi:bifunctional diguanylate cyclase/phosphodiesterase [Pelagibacterium xiamenense]|uniref:bifunctional diguanylate cyclase/phosphodiesterase n=1 Tax=Pelagibacterium xiamenense TaxID=2901140 RepID=UPI001E32BD6F|nr:bifunctional diguanylate cyclase/phosphodiesterase [Pelagibacterium xiamenense]MCD7058885.1 EAL domain-containing protein [Pelagibacterium xiamenense]